MPVDVIASGDPRPRDLLYLKLDRAPQAIDDLETYLRLAPDAADAEEIQEQVAGLKRRVATVH